MTGITKTPASEPGGEAGKGAGQTPAVHEPAVDAPEAEATPPAHVAEPAPRPPVVSTSGSARRRAKVAARIAASHDLEVNWAFLNDAIPPSAVSVMGCSCGSVAWLMPGADREAFDRECDDHADCWEDAA